MNAYKKNLLKFLVLKTLINNFDNIIINANKKYLTKLTYNKTKNFIFYFF